MPVEAHEFLPDDKHGALNSISTTQRMLHLPNNYATCAGFFLPYYTSVHQTFALYHHNQTRSYHAFPGTELSENIRQLLFQPDIPLHQHRIYVHPIDTV